LAQIDHGYSAFGFTDLEKLVEVASSHHSLAKLEPGNGHSVLIGLDKILGIGDSSLLSQELLMALKNKDICYLYQARAQSSTGFITDQWKSNLDLGLIGDFGY
jgi:hypothetical protein